MIVFYGNAIGTPYFHSLLDDLISEISDKNVSLELDPIRLQAILPGSDSEAIIEINTPKVVEYAQRFLFAILNGLHQIPPEFSRLMNCLVKRSSKKFPESKQRILARFLFGGIVK